MQYVLLIYGDENDWRTIGEDEWKAIDAEYGAFSDDLRAQGKLIDANELQGTETATTVRVREGEVLMTDGPFAETKECLGGYFLIEADWLEEALEWAARIPNARDGVIEVRPVAMRQAEVAR
jgi:hypothetical protein